MGTGIDSQLIEEGWELQRQGKVSAEKLVYLLK
jgi:hypothetical protein